MHACFSWKGCQRACFLIVIVVSKIKCLLGYFHIHYCEQWTLSSLPMPREADTAALREPSERCAMNSYEDFSFLSGWNPRCAVPGPRLGLPFPHRLLVCTTALCFLFGELPCHTENLGLKYLLCGVLKPNKRCLCNGCIEGILEFNLFWWQSFQNTSVIRVWKRTTV